MHDLSAQTFPYAQLYKELAAQVNAPASVACRLLPDLSPRLKRRERWMGLLLALGITAGYFYFLLCFWAPADGRDDQNGYLVGGRQYAHSFSTAYKPVNDFAFVGDMWVRAPDGTNYPKYPIGLSMLYAASLRLLGDAPGAPGVRWAFLVSPICSAMAMLGIYFLARRLAGVLASIGAMLLYGFGPASLLFANNSNSHAASVGFVVWGMYFMVRHWQTGSIGRGLLGGFLLGFAVTIRYTEGTHALVIALAALCMVRSIWPSILLGGVTVIALAAGVIHVVWPLAIDEHRFTQIDYGLAVAGTVSLLTFIVWNAISGWRALLTVMVPTIAWLIPVGYLLAFNHHAMGTLTGYDTTHESGQYAFTIANFEDNWEKAIREIHNVGVFFYLPLGLLGMLALLQWSVRFAMALVFWVVPGIIIYMFYYWAPESGGWYLRFFMTVFPAFAVGSAFVFRQMHRRGWGSGVAVGAIVAVACSMNLYRGMWGVDGNRYSDQGMREQYFRAANLAGLGEIAARAVPAGSTIFAMPDELYYLQFIGQYDCYRADAFRRQFRDEMFARLRNPQKADQFQKERSQFLVNLYAGKSDRDLVAIQNQIMSEALTGGRRVFAVLNRDLVEDFRRKFCRDATRFTVRTAATYREMPRLPEVDPSNRERGQQRRRQWDDEDPPPCQRFVILEVTTTHPASLATH